MAVKSTGLSFASIQECFPVAASIPILDGMSGPALGVFFATLSATLWAVQYLCVRVGTDDGAVTDALFVTLLCNVFLVLPIVVAFYWSSFVELFTPVSVLSFVAAGMAGTLFARLLMYESVNTIGASRTSPIIAANVFFATILAVVFLGERLTTLHFLGIVFIVGGVAVISWETASSEPDQSLREVGLSILLPVTAAAAIGFEPIFISYGLSEGTPVLPGFLVMATAATVGFVGYLTAVGRRIRVPIRTPSMVWYVGAGVSSTISLVAYFAALEVAPVVIVVPLLQTTPLIVLVLSAVFLPQRLERVTLKVVTAAAVVVVGATIVSLSG